MQRNQSAIPGHSSVVPKPYCDTTGDGAGGAAFCLSICGTYIVVFMAEARESRAKYGTHQRSKQSVQLSKKLMIMTVNECDQVNMWLGSQQRVQRKKGVLA